MSYKAKTEMGLFGPIAPLANHGQTTSSENVQVVRIARADGGDALYDYAVPDDMRNTLSPGQRVEVPFGRGNRSQAAFCIEFPETSEFSRLKYISSVIDEQPLLTEELVELAKWISQYYCYPLGLVLSAIVPAAVKKQAGAISVQYIRVTEKLIPWLTGEVEELTNEKTGKKFKLSPKGKRALEVIKELEAKNNTNAPDDLENKLKELKEELKGSGTFNCNSDHIPDCPNPTKISTNELKVSDTFNYKLLEICNLANCGKPVFRTLGKNGLLEFYTKREMPSDELLNLMDQQQEDYDDETAPQNGTSDSSPIFDFGDEPDSETDESFSNRIQLNDDQLKAVAAIKGNIDTAGFNATLLHGVTGSGKTEVYMECIQKVVDRGQQAIVLVPEIALTPQTERRFIDRFGSVAVLHSGMTGIKRHQQWRQIAEGRANVVVGARSAVFAPVPNLGLIVVDEEHEGSYKQDQSPRYHGRDVAIKRAHQNNITIILGSATPSLETLTNCERRDDFKYVTMPNRVKNLPLPKISIVNLKDELKKGRKDRMLSELLEKELRQCIAAGRQAILFLNRRGHSNLLYCPSCQYTVTCPNCDVSLKVHRRKELERVTGRMLMCHHCLHATKVPESCPVCQKKLIMLGPGTQQAEDQLLETLKDLRVQRVDSDSMKPGDYRKVLSQFGRGDIDVLIGTQMIAKGLDFPNVSLVGIINADTALAVPDYRSSERTFQLISQVAGRCGRADDSGRVVLQSYMPDEPAIEFATRHDFNGFARLEKQIRQKLEMPPYWRMARIIMTDPLLEKLEEEAKRIRLILDDINQKLDNKLTIHGPMPAAIARLERYHRAELIIKAPTPGPIQQLLATLRQGTIENTQCRIVIDVDPVSMM